MQPILKQRRAPTRSLSWSILCFQVVCIVVGGWFGAGLPLDNSIDRFAVSGDTTDRQFQRLKREFGDREPFIVCIRLQPNSDQQLHQAIETLFNELAQLPGIVNKFSAADVPAWTSPELFPFFNQKTLLHAALFQIEKHPQRDQRLQALVNHIDNFARQRPRQVAQAFAAGEPLVNLQLNRGSQEVKTRFFPALIGLSLLLLGCLFRDWRVLVAAGLAIGAALASVMGLLAAFGRELNLITTLIPALVFVLAVAMQLHILVAIAHGGVLNGVFAKLKPNLLVALTTSIGFGSLTVSKVTPIAEMGLVMAAAIWLIFFWCHLTHLGWSLLVNLEPNPPSFKLLALPSSFPAYRRLCQSWLVVPAMTVFIGLGAWWLVVNPTESNGLNYFAAQAPIRIVTQQLQQQVTGASNIELLIAKPRALPADRQLQLEAELLKLPGVRHLFSPWRIVELSRPPLPGIVRPPLAIALQQFQQARPDHARELISPNDFRIRLLVDSMDRQAYLKLLGRMETLFADFELKEVGVTGTLPRVIAIQDYLLRSLAVSLLLTISLVVLLMGALLGTWRRPLLVLLPNLFPLAVMASAMAALDITTSISTVMAFSIAFGIAVDDTIHLIYAFENQTRGSFWRRWRSLTRHDFVAISLTSLALSHGFGVLLLSSFAPTREFGLLLAVGMLAAWLGDLLFLPALLPKQGILGSLKKENKGGKAKLIIN